jgi:hypothetical protein
MRIFVSKAFAKFARQERISTAKLLEVIRDAEAGKIDADYGGNVIKQRIARPNEGKSGGYRSIILFRRGDKAFFVYGFAKNERDNITLSEERGLKELANSVFSYSEAELTNFVHEKSYEEVEYHD